MFQNFNQTGLRTTDNSACWFFSTLSTLVGIAQFSLVWIAKASSLSWLLNL
jgi:hypothetical protein